MRKAVFISAVLIIAIGCVWFITRPSGDSTDTETDGGTVHVTSTVVNPEDTRPVQVLNLEDLEEDYLVLAEDDLEVYYPEGKKSVAELVMAELVRMKRFANDHAGVRLKGAFGAVLVEPSPSRSRVVVKTKVKEIWPLELPFWEASSGGQGTSPSLSAAAPYWYLLHEWAESSLELNGLPPGGKLQETDDGTWVYYGRLRFVGDGVPEWLCFEYCRRHHPEVALALREHTGLELSTEVDVQKAAREIDRLRRLLEESAGQR